MSPPPASSPSSSPSSSSSSDDDDARGAFGFGASGGGGGGDGRGSGSDGDGGGGFPKINNHPLSLAADVLQQMQSVALGEEEETNKVKAKADVGVGTNAPGGDDEEEKEDVKEAWRCSDDAASDISDFSDSDSDSASDGDDDSNTAAAAAGSNSGNNTAEYEVTLRRHKKHGLGICFKPHFTTLLLSTGAGDGADGANSDDGAGGIVVTIVDPELPFSTPRGG